MGLTRKNHRNSIALLGVLAFFVGALWGCGDDSSSDSSQSSLFIEDPLQDSVSVDENADNSDEDDSDEKESGEKASTVDADSTEVDDSSDSSDVDKKDSTEKKTDEKESVDSLDVDADTTRQSENSHSTETDSIMAAIEAYQDTLRKYLDIPSDSIPRQRDFLLTGVIDIPSYKGDFALVANIENGDNGILSSHLSGQAKLDADKAFAEQFKSLFFPYFSVSITSPYSEVHNIMSLNAFVDLSSRSAVALNMFSHLVGLRITAQQKDIVSPTKFRLILEEAEKAVWKAFRVDDSSFDTSLVYTYNGKESGAAALAIYVLVDSWVRHGSDLSKGVASPERFDSLETDFGEDGEWNDLRVRAAVADLALEMDAADGFAELRKEFADAKLGEVPDFEKYVRNFYQGELGIEPCGENNAETVFFVPNENSRFFASDVDGDETVKEHFVCKADGGVEMASDSLLDLLSLAEVGEDGEVVRGAFTGNFFTYDKTLGAWRTSTAVERDSYFVKLSATDKFVDIQDVYEGLKSNERVIFVLRHAERTDDTSKSGTLTSNGKKQSENVGAKLMKFSESFRLGASQFLRAQQTVEYIARGRGQAYDVMDTLPELNDDWYVKDKSAKDKAESDAGGGWEATSKYAYTGAYTTGATPAYHNLQERSVELIEDVLLAKYNNPEERFVVLSSHDKLMMPLVVYCSNMQVNLKKYDGGHWINYLAGVAIIVDDKNNRRYVPVKGMNSEYMN